MNQSLERAGELAQQAFTLNVPLPEAHMILGSLYVWQKQHDRDIAEAERAVALDPNGAECTYFWEVLLALQGNRRKALRLRSLGKLL